MIRFTLPALLIAATAIGSTADAAQQNRNCAPRDKVIARLSDGYGETRQSVGLGVNNVVVETFASAETGTWTITVTTAAGVTCLVASGQAFETASINLPEGALAPDL